MAKGVIFPNRQAFNGKNGAVNNYASSNIQNYNATKWSDGIDALDESGQVLMLVDDRVINFPWSPEQVVDIDITNSKWFNSEL